MSNLLEQASLVMIPSGYKEDVVYSEIPIDGAGDLSFTRSSNGTRVNSAGLVEVCPWNLLEQSSVFNVSPWAFVGGTTLTSGFSDVNGTLNAFRFQATSGSYKYGYQTISSTIGQVYTHSIYAKCSSGTQQLKLTDAQQGGGSLQTVTTEWQRFTFTLTASGGNIAIELGSDGTNALDIYICFAQTNIGSTAKPYFPTTDRLNVPRLTYQNGGGGCPSLLLEKQSTNYVVSSQNLTGFWNLSNTTATANSTTSPDGTQNASKLEDDSVNAQHRYFQNILNGLTNETISFSIYAKQGTHRYISWGITDDSDYRGQVVVDLQTGTITDQFTTSATLSNLSVASQGNGWYRISGTIAVSSNYAGGNAYGFGLMLNSSSWSTASYTGTGTYCYLWGGQAELSSYPTSYIPTTSSSATRVADACSKTGISSLIGQTEGVLFVDFNWEQKEGVFFINSISDGTTNNDIFMAFGSSANNRIRFSIASGGVNYVNEDSAVLSSGRYKIAFAYASNDAVVYINGTQLFTDSSVTVPATSAFKFLRANDTLGFNGTINQQLLFKTRLTNAELASLTTI